MRIAFLSAAFLLATALPAYAHNQAPSTPVAPSLPADAQDPALLKQVQAILLAAPAGTRFGLMVETLDGKPLLAIAPDQRFIPASNTKLFTTAAIYANLPRLQQAARGAALRMERGRHGVPDIVLVGHGDPNLSSAPDCEQDCLATLADAVAARTRRVRNIIGDDSFYPDERWSPGMSWNNIPYRSGTGISALTLDDNEFVVTIAPGGEGKAPLVTDNGYYKIANTALTEGGEASGLDVWRMPGDDVVYLSGNIGVAAGPMRFRLGIDDPARYAAFRFRQMLVARGVKVSGAIQVRHRPLSKQDNPENRQAGVLSLPPEPPVFAELPPPSLAEDVTLTNTVSQNLHAELLLRRLGRLEGSGSIADGEAIVAQTLAQAGIPDGGYFFADGSGMSSYNRVTARTTAALLRWAATQPWGAQWQASLPVGGVDGTLERRFKGTALEGRIRAKTGSLNASRALSGYMQAASGRMLIFAAYANDIPAKGEGLAIAAMDKALLAIAAAN